MQNRKRTVSFIALGGVVLAGVGVYLAMGKNGKKKNHKETEIEKQVREDIEKELDKEQKSEMPILEIEEENLTFGPDEIAFSKDFNDYEMGPEYAKTVIAEALKDARSVKNPDPVLGKANGLAIMYPMSMGLIDSHEAKKSREYFIEWFLNNHEAQTVGGPILLSEIPEDSQALEDLKEFLRSGARIYQSLLSGLAAFKN